MIKKLLNATLTRFIEGTRQMQLLIMLMLIQCIFLIQNVVSLPWWEMEPHEVRDRLNKRIMSIDAPIPPVYSIVDHVVTGDNRTTPIRVYTPNDDKQLSLILLIHGGAWVAGNLDTHDNLARYLCSETKAIVIAVGYLNAPEGKFPLPLEQCYDTLTWINAHAQEWSGDPSRLAVIGDSAGGNMSAALCLMARDRQGLKIAMQVLINPAPDLTCQGSLERKDDELDQLRWSAKQYLSDPHEANHPYVSPLAASHLNDLPPALILLAEQDDLREAGQKYADRLQAAGVPTQVYCQLGIGHLAGDGARASLRARESLDVAIAVLRKTL